MNNDNEYKEYLELKDKINFHNYRYHVLDNPVISDFEFDQFLKQLRRIEEKHPQWITQDSPTQRIGAAPSERFEKVIHPKRILSLANAFSEEDLQSWFSRINKLDERVENAQIILEPKIDGLTVVLIYQNGILIQGATRGNGEVGEDITQNIRTIQSVPLKIPVNNDSLEVPEVLAIRAEAFIAKNDFILLNKRLAQKGEKTYQNPRNTAAGSLRLLDPTCVAERPLRILAYAIVTGNPKNTQWETLEYIKALGFPVSEIALKCNSFKDMLSELKQWNAYRNTLDYEIDGVVIKINNLVMAEDLGFVGKDPRGAIALKFPAQEVTTRLLDIGVNIGRTGILTPYAILKPVEVGGVVVKKASLHNFDFIKKKDIRIKDQVLVKRAGEVIPYIIGPITDVRTGEEREYIPSSVCPVCDMPVESVPDEVAWYCLNSTCPAQIIRNIEHFVSRTGMDIVGLGIRIVEKLVEVGLIHDVADLYRLKVDDLLSLEGFAEKKGENIISGINRSKDQSLTNLITALGIHGVGEVAAEELASHFRDLAELSRAEQVEIEAIEGFGPNTAEAVKKWFSSDKNIGVVEKLRTYGVWPESRSNQTSNSKTLNGLHFAVTGTLDDFTREGIRKYIKQFGGKVSDTISNKTNYLVLGKNPGSKLEKAKSMGIKVITENELRKIAEVDS